MIHNINILLIYIQFTIGFHNKLNECIFVLNVCSRTKNHSDLNITGNAKYSNHKLREAFLLVFDRIFFNSYS